MVRLFAVALSVGMLLATSVTAQEPAFTFAGKWEVNVTGRPVRLLELTVDGSVVTGTLTKDGSSTTMPVTGELRATSLTFQTKDRDEFFGLAFGNGRLQGTYLYDGGSPENCYKTGVTMKRPAW